MLAYIIFTTVFLGLSSGAIIQPRVSSNSSSAIQRFSFTAAILYGPTGYYRQVCGGAVLTATAVLSAASCLDTQGRPNPVSQYRVRAGSAQPNAGGSVVSIYLINLHPNYNYKTLQSDIAVLRTDTLTYSAAVQPVAVAGANYYVSDNDDVLVIGWGQNQSVSAELRNTLRYVQQKVVNPSYCKALLGYEGLTVTDGMLCTSRAGGEFCDGDYGGPVVHAATGVLVGVAAYSYRCGERRYPSVSTRVAAYTNWIVDAAK
ncbi:trypsin, alkaline B-like [Leguminivora glycinivorella]|uniref:trypsin, alkaline B-like n=1 Tax=Leguminivora glycinivorella TaxID=1035111 RepID=UPI002010C12F|nr:trypsin, alkaline B-like [Leguminivora glycinivorella]